MSEDMILLDTPTKSKDELKELRNLERMMEEMANAPKEPEYKRQPGERCSYEKSVGQTLVSRET